MANQTSTELRRRPLLVLGAAAVGLPMGMANAKSGILLEVWKDPSCGCCKDWVTHLQSNGFQVKVHEVGNNGVRAQLGIDRKYGSCHTAVVGGYAVEGHVPAGDIHRLLRERPRARGLAVPGMPVGSPGMDGAVYKGRKDAYDVLLLSFDGGSSIYRRYG